MRLYKKLLVGILTLGLIGSTVSAVTLNTMENERQISKEIPVVYVNGTRYVQLRSFCEVYGFELGWDATTKGITIQVGDETKTVRVEQLKSNNEGFIDEDRTYVSVGWIEETLGLAVEEDTAGELALQVVTRMIAGEYTEVIHMMDEVSATLIEPNLLKDSWESIGLQFGNILDYEVDQVNTLADGTQLVDVKVFCEKAHVKVKTSFNTMYQLTGLRIEMYIQDRDLPVGAVEKEMVVRTGQYQLPATLTLPSAEGDYPVVVLVHGSGPIDRDGTVGGVKVYRDFAYGLAEQGIATLRYDKRTYVHIDQYMTQPTLFDYEEEVIDDALSAINLLKVTEQIDKDNIYVLGHSLGGMSIPLISTKDEGVAGYVMVAAPARSLVDIVVEQLDYLYDVQELSETDKARSMEMVEEQAEKVRNLKVGEEEVEVGLAGINNKMWADFNSYDQVEVATKMEEPLFIIQGGRDYQVTMEDYNIWEEVLGDRENVKLKAYADLNHILVTGEGKSIPDEYLMPNTIADEVVVDIGTWILEHSQTESEDE